jgi:hypothetical protein
MVSGVALRLDAEGRSERRDEVMHRTRAVKADGATCSVVIVNLSPGGLMARCDGAFADDELLQVELPGLGLVPAEVRWALGGRIGCQFVSAVSVEGYYRLLGIVGRV